MSDDFALVGRDDLIATVAAVATGAGGAPPALILLGEKGIGKTAVLRAAVRAVSGEVRVLFASGAPNESARYTPLVTLLWPIWSFANALPPVLRAPLTRLMHDPADESLEPELLREAVLALLEAAAADGPVLVALDDVDRFDQEARHALVQLAAHLGVARVRAVLTAQRLDGLGLLDRTIRTVDIGALTPDLCAKLIDSQPLQPDPSVRGEIIRWTRGNPLALIDVTRAHARAGATRFDGAAMCGAAIDPVIVNQIACLPPDTRRLLMYAAAGTGQETVDMITEAAGFGQDFAAWEPARRARCVEFTGDRRVRFANSLLCSAAYAEGDYGEQRAAHLALASMPSLDAASRAWHLSSRTSGPDELVADALEHAVSPTRQHGSELTRARLLQRAAELSPERADAARRFALAAGAANFAGDPAWALSLADVPLREAADPNVAGYAALTRASILLQAASADDAFATIREVLDGRWPDDAHLVLALVHLAAGVAYYTGVRQHRRELGGWLLRTTGIPLRDSCFPLPFPPAAAELQRAYITMYVETGITGLPPAALDRHLRQPQPPAVEPYRRLVAGVMAYACEESGIAMHELAGAVDHLTAAGGLRGYTFALAPLCWTLLDTGHWTRLESLLGDTAAACAAAHGLGLMARENAVCTALLMAMRGDVDAARRFIEQAWRLSSTAVRQPCATSVALDRAAGWTAVAAGDFDEAYRRFRAMFTEDGQPVHFVVSPRGIADLAWAAARSGRAAQLQPLIAAIGRQLGSKPPVRLRLLRHQALALTTTSQVAERHYKLAVFDPTGEQWPLERARARLHYGEWLRRARRPAEARPLLSAALEVFERLGAQPLADIARAELRAAGVTTAEPANDDALQALTAQERQIVALAASGLTNREIGVRLKLSPRTIASHLYHVYPKLGVTRRHELREFAP